MKYLIIIPCILLIGLAFFILIRQVVRSVNGKNGCDGNCQGCQYSQSCGHQQEDHAKHNHK